MPWVAPLDREDATLNIMVKILKVIMVDLPSLPFFYDDA